MPQKHIVANLRLQSRPILQIFLSWISSYEGLDCSPKVNKTYILTAKSYLQMHLQDGTGICAATNLVTRQIHRKAIIHIADIKQRRRGGWIQTHQLESRWWDWEADGAGRPWDDKWMCWWGRATAGRKRSSDDQEKTCGCAAASCRELQITCRRDLS